MASNGIADPGGNEERANGPMRFPRRMLFQGTAAGVAGQLFLTSGCVPDDPGGGPNPGPNPVTVENQLTGNWGWEQPTYAEGRAPSPRLDAYLSKVSVLPGDSVELKISTNPVQDYRLDFFRIGNYGGIGARRMTPIPGTVTTGTGTIQPIPTPAPGTGLVKANWPTSQTFTVPSDWLSGLYVCNVVLTSGPLTDRAVYCPFVVRPTATRHAKALVIAASTTWQAYNGWGGNSLYEYNSPNGRAHKVSFDRPYQLGDQNVYEWEVPVARWLEANNFDVAYASDLDFHDDPNILLGYKAVIFDGHDEYWTTEMRNAVDWVRDGGTNLAFIAADVAYWHIRLENSGRDITCYKDAALDPEPDLAKKTVLFRNLVPPRPEAALCGVQFEDGFPAGNKTYTVESSTISDPWFTGTGFSAGDSIPGIVGYEYDTKIAGYPASPVTTFFRYGGSPAEELPSGASVRYTAASGAVVWSTGTMDWGLHLDDPRIAAFTKNALNALITGSVAGPNVAPSVSVTSPVAGASILPGSTLALEAAASDDVGAVSVEFFVDGVSVGTKTAAPWSVTWVATGSGTHQVTARATDGAGASTLSAAVSISVTGTPPVGAVALVGAAKGSNNGGASSVVLGLPAGAQAGDVVIVGVQCALSETGDMIPAGFTLVTDHRPSSSWHPRLVVSHGVVGAGQSSVTVPTGAIGATVAAAVYRGVSPAAPVAGFAAASADGSSVTVASVSAAAAGSRLVMLLGAQNHSSPGVFTPPAAMTLVADQTADPWQAAAVADQSVGAGGSGTRTVAFSQEAALTAVVLALTPV